MTDEMMMTIVARVDKAVCYDESRGWIKRSSKGTVRMMMETGERIFLPLPSVVLC